MTRKGGRWPCCARGASESPNVEGAYLEVMADTVGSVGVIVAGVLVAATGQALFDTVVAIAIAVFVVVRAIALGRQVLAGLGQHAPEGLDVDAVAGELAAIGGVQDVHDLHTPRFRLRRVTYQNRQQRHRDEPDVGDEGAGQSRGPAGDGDPRMRGGTAQPVEGGDRQAAPARTAVETRPITRWNTPSCPLAIGRPPPQGVQQVARVLGRDGFGEPGQDAPVVVRLGEGVEHQLDRVLLPRAGA